MEVDRNRYYETGRLQVGEGGDGLPVIAGGEPQDADVGLTDDNLICAAGPGRPKCEFYGRVLLDADGEAKGYGKMKQIRRFCRKLQTAAELFEIDQSIYGCCMREPADRASEQLINNFEAKQKRLAEEAAETTGSLDF
jgi:hypothetical protein